MGEQPWWHPTSADTDSQSWGGKGLPEVIRLGPDYGAALPLWGKGLGNIAWQYLLGFGLSPGLLDRLAAWQGYFDDHYRYGGGWDSAAGRDEWGGQAAGLAADIRDELGGRAQVELWLWPLGRG